MYAAQYGHESLVRDLLRAGSNPAVVEKDGGTALKAAQLNGHRGVAQILEEAMGGLPR